MSQGPSFAQILFLAPPIHAANGKKSDVLEKQPQDFASMNKPRAPHGLDGNGTHHSPFMIKQQATESAHFGVVDLWYAVKDKPGGPHFIKVNTWVFKVTPTGVVTDGNKTTRLLPLP